MPGGMADNHPAERLVQSTPGSPQERGRPNSFEVIGSAESLVGRVCIKLNCCLVSISNN